MNTGHTTTPVGITRTLVSSVDISGTQTGVKEIARNQASSAEAFPRRLPRSLTSPAEALPRRIPRSRASPAEALPRRVLRNQSSLASIDPRWINIQSHSSTWRQHLQPGNALACASLEWDAALLRQVLLCTFRTLARARTRTPLEGDAAAVQCVVHCKSWNSRAGGQTAAVDAAAFAACSLPCWHERSFRRGCACVGVPDKDGDLATREGLSSRINGKRGIVI